MASGSQSKFDSERTKAIAQVQTHKQRFRARATHEFFWGIGLVALLFIYGVIAESVGFPHNKQAVERDMGVIGIGALVAFGLAAAHWCASLRRPAKTLMRPVSAYTNPEDAMAAAFQLDMHGDWDAANALYGEVARRWREHEQYAQGRITEIEEKQSRANQP
jgi:hypothetical protein